MVEAPGGRKRGLMVLAGPRVTVAYAYCEPVHDKKDSNQRQKGASIA